jgi:hypothetical protein
VPTNPERAKARVAAARIWSRRSARLIRFVLAGFMASARAGRNCIGASS